MDLKSDVSLGTGGSVIRKMPILLTLVSPVRGCGKTTALSVLDALCHRAVRCDGATAAAIFHRVHLEHPTLLCDEVDTYGLQRNEGLRGVFNSGLTRADGSSQLRELDEASAVELEALRAALYAWSKGACAVLKQRPEMPPELRNWPADNWRPLIAIADACGGEWGRRAREAAVAVSASLPEEDLGVTLLEDIRRIFDAQRVDRIASQALVDALVAMDDAPWSEWQGIKGDGQPRPLSQTGLAQILRPFGIRPRTIWPAPRVPGCKSARATSARSSRQPGERTAGRRMVGLHRGSASCAAPEPTHRHMRELSRRYAGTCPAQAPRSEPEKMLRTEGAGRPDLAEDR